MLGFENVETLKEYQGEINKAPFLECNTNMAAV